MKRKLSSEDYEFVNSLNAAISEQTPKKMKWVLYFWFIAIMLFIIWASLTQIDEITRGSGEVVPSGKNQIVQNLEGGIVKKILVKVGDIVERNQPLLKIDNQKSESQLDSTRIKEFELEAKITRLRAEAYGQELNITKEMEKRMPILIYNEKSLYKSRKSQIDSKIRGLRDQEDQKIQEYKETESRLKLLKKSTKLIKKELSMMKPMVAQGVKSKVAYMKLQREESKIQEDLNSAVHSLPRIRSSISEIENNIEEAVSDFRNQAKKELNEATAELMRVKKSENALGDQIDRTLVRSPIKGIIQKLYVHTVGGVIKPGENLIEIVPTDDVLWLEVKIKPSDIAFVYPGQKAIVKFSAYDFAIYGGLDGEVVHISADTVKDEKDNSFYTVHIKTDKNHLGSESKPLKIIPGMTASVDIVTGKKSIMDYILKPILKAKQYTFTER
ncbi:HlyD family secretion protein [hydrothermal vent metagenome]|uniref:HlyD family secretion protein n=1 Tax=hydrothermal vent metagenome TaxID=652676 RepID=A0A1W1CBH8_9ZZZZ